MYRTSLLARSHHHHYGSGAAAAATVTLPISKLMSVCTAASATSRGLLGSISSTSRSRNSSAAFAALNLSPQQQQLRAFTSGYPNLEEDYDQQDRHFQHGAYHCTSVDRLSDLIRLVGVTATADEIAKHPPKGGGGGGVMDKGPNYDPSRIDSAIKSLGAGTVIPLPPSGTVHSGLWCLEEDPPVGAERLGPGLYTDIARGCAVHSWAATVESDPLKYAASGDKRVVLCSVEHPVGASWNEPPGALRVSEAMPKTPDLHGADEEGNFKASVAPAATPLAFNSEKTREGMYKAMNAAKNFLDVGPDAMYLQDVVVSGVELRVAHVERPPFAVPRQYKLNATSFHKLRLRVVEVFADPETAKAAVAGDPDPHQAVANTEARLKFSNDIAKLHNEAGGVNFHELICAGTPQDSNCFFSAIAFHIYWSAPERTWERHMLLCKLGKDTKRVGLKSSLGPRWAASGTRMRTELNEWLARVCYRASLADVVRFDTLMAESRITPAGRYFDKLCRSLDTLVPLDAEDNEDEDGPADGPDAGGPRGQGGPESAGGTEVSLDTRHKDKEVKKMQLPLLTVIKMTAAGLAWGDPALWWRPVLYVFGREITVFNQDEWETAKVYGVTASEEEAELQLGIDIPRRRGGHPIELAVSHSEDMTGGVHYNPVMWRGPFRMTQL